MQKKSNPTINIILNKEKVQSVDWIKLLGLTIINKFWILNFEKNIKFDLWKTIKIYHIIENIMRYLWYYFIFMFIKFLIWDILSLSQIII